ncbi:T9SS type A sorting domain-containing protein [bacterium]|nr:T9SS type A sorting domain-containing protein [bacterium]
MLNPFKDLLPMHFHPKRDLLPAALLIVCLVSTARADVDTLWTRVFSFGTTTSFSAGLELPTGGFAVAGYSITGSNEDALLVRLDPLGDTLWTRSFGAPNAGERFTGICQFPNGNLGLCGRAQSAATVLAAVYSLSGDLLWSRSFTPSSGASEAAGLLPAPDGGLYVLGRRVVSNRELDFWLIRCAQNGDSLWSYTYGTTTMDIPDNILPGDGGTLELFGSTRNPTTNLYDFLRVTVDANGQAVSQTVYGDPALYETMGAAFREPETGDYILAGERRVTSSDYNGYALRLSPQGSVLWEQHYSAGFASEKLGGAAPYLEGGVLFAGWSGPGLNTATLWLVAVGANGDSIWSWRGTEPGRQFEDLKALSDGGYLICGSAYVNGAIRGLAWRMSPPSGVSGVVRDRTTNELIAGVQISAAELPQYAISDSSGRFTLSLPAGIYTVYSGGPCFTGDTLYNIEVIANENTSADLTVGVPHMTLDNTTVNVLAQNRIPGAAVLPLYNSGSGDLVFSFETEAVMPEGDWLTTIPVSGRVAPGETLNVQVQVLADTLDDGTYDYFGFLYLRSNSCPETLRTLQVLAVILDADETPLLPSEFRLYPAYPNPFNSSTRLRFALDRDSEVSLTVFDLQGRHVADLLGSTRLSAGVHELTWDANGLASGLYFVRLQDQLRSQTQRLLFLR